MYFLKYFLPSLIIVFHAFLCCLFNYQFESLIPTSILSLICIFYFEKINKDFLVIAYAYILGFLTYAALSLDNADLRGWWTFAVVAHTLLAIILATIFAVIARIQNKPHTTYSLFFGISIFAILAGQAYIPPNINLNVFGFDNTLITILICWVMLHFLLSLLFRSI